MPDHDQGFDSSRLIDILGLLGGAGGGLVKGAGMALAKTSPTALGMLKLFPKDPNPFTGRPSSPGFPGHTSFDVLNEGAGVVGNMWTHYNPETKNIHVHGLDSMIDSPYKPESIPFKANEGSWSLGPENMRSLIDELKRIYPEAKTGSANRSSGIRQGPASTVDTSSFVTRTLPGRE